MKRHAPAKINIFLKIIGRRGGYHEIRSRFIRVDQLFDTLYFRKKTKPSASFELICDTALPRQNSVSEAYRLLKKEAPKIEKFFKEYAVLLEKRIPQGSGLGGGSSDAASFLHLCNEVCGLNLSKNRLALIGERVGADVPFFIYGYQSANVEGIGEIISPFEEEQIRPTLLTPPIHCNTSIVFKTFRSLFSDKIDKYAGKKWLQLTSRELLEKIPPKKANDLFDAALYRYPQLQEYILPNQFLSGSGSTLFSLN